MKFLTPNKDNSYPANLTGFTRLNPREARCSPKANNLTGFTLSELLITIAILSLVLLGVYSSYFLSQKAYREGERAAEILQNGRVILERASREIRQAKEIAGVFPETESEATSTILFHDGHLSLIFEEGNVQEASAGAVTLADSAASLDDYYKDTFIKIIGGAGTGQIRKVNHYNGSTKIAEVEQNWEVVPDSGSIYKIDSSYYYIHYYKEGTDVRRRIISYYFSGFPDTFAPWNAIPPEGQTLETQILEEPRTIGEYVKDLKFWGGRVVSVSISLEKQQEQLNLSTKIFSRNF